MDYKYLVKIALIGDYKVGKTNIMLNYVDDHFKDDYVPTDGVDFKFRTIKLDGEIIKVQIWETSEKPKNRPEHSFLRNIHGVIICYDVTDKKSFDSIEKQWHSVADIIGYENNAIKLVVGNKSDLNDNRQVTYDEGQQLAKQMGCGFFETSAKKSINIEEIFTAILSGILKEVRNIEKEESERLLSLEKQKNCVLLEKPESKPKNKCYA